MTSAGSYAAAAVMNSWGEYDDTASTYDGSASVTGVRGGSDASLGSRGIPSDGAGEYGRGVGVGV